MNIRFSRTAGAGMPITNSFQYLQGVEGQYIPYSGDSLIINTANRYPQVLSHLATNAPTHGSALQKKSKLTYGQGFDMDALPDNVVEFLLNCNDTENANDILRKTAYDLVTFGGVSLKVHWTYSREIHAIEHVPFKNVRLGMPNEQTKEIDYFIISNDWEKKMDLKLRKEYRVNKFNPEMIEEPQIVDNEAVASDQTLDNACQLIYYTSYSVGSDGYYPLPDYLHCLDSAFNEIHTGVAMNNSISNGLNGTYIISSPDTMLDEVGQQEVINMFDRNIAGAANAGSVIYLNDSIKVDKLEAVEADTYTEVNKETRQRIITGHGVPAVLLEYSYGSTLSNRSTEIQSAIAMLQDTLIAGYQQELIRIFNNVLQYVSQEDFELGIIPFKINFDNDSEQQVDTVSVDSDDTSSVESVNDEEI